MAQDYTFKGWLGLDKNALGNMKWDKYEPKPFEENDVDIQVTHSGICGSDIHTLRSGWAPTNYPCVVGHEIVGKAVRVGSKAERGIKVGDRVGVGAQSNSCLKPDCDECSNGLEQHCTRLTGTYDSKFPDGSKSYGGYGLYARVPSHFVFKIPEGVTSADAAPMLCGGVTVFSPLLNYGCKPGANVGIVGVGGLGHFGVLFAKGLGADKVIGISRSNNKREDVLKMGADDYIATEEDKDWHKKFRGSLDLIVCTISSPNLPLEKYLSMLRTKGRFVQVGVPEEKLPAFHAFSVIPKGLSITGSAIGSPKEIEEMLDLAAKKSIKPWIQERPMSDANQATIDMDKGNARYRYVLVNDDAKL